MGCCNSNILSIETDIDNINDIIYLNKNTYNFFSSVFFDGIDWIYCSVESILSFNYKIWYLWENLSNYDDNYDFFFNYYWYLSLSVSPIQLFYSIILDYYYYLLSNDNQYNNEWLRSIIFSRDYAFIWLYHPELLFYFNQLDNFFIKHYSNQMDFIYLDNSIIDTCTTAYNLFIHLIFFFFLSSFFLSILFNFYGNSNTEESTIDFDFVLANSVVEAEKEITAFDDFISILFIMCYIFGIFFYIHGWLFTLSNTALMLTFYSIILMIIFVLGIPTIFLYDLGIFFTVYLRGIGKKSNILAEIFYDYVVCAIFYTRVFAQWVRIFIIFVTFLSLSHFIAEFELVNSILINSENQFENNYELNINFFTTYFILTVLPGKILYWIFELSHTIILVTSQFVSFFAITFWLFSFLYTFFIIEKHENFFSEKRKERRNKIKNIFLLRN